MMGVGKFGGVDCTGTRYITPINSTQEEVEMKLTDQVKEAAPEEANAVPSTPTPDPTVEAVAPTPKVEGSVPAVPAASAAETTAGYENGGSASAEVVKAEVAAPAPPAAPTQSETKEEKKEE